MQGSSLPYGRLHAARSLVAGEQAVCLLPSAENSKLPVGADSVASQDSYLVTMTESYPPLPYCEDLCAPVSDTLPGQECQADQVEGPTSSSGYELGSSNSPLTTCRSPHTDLR